MPHMFRTSLLLALIVSSCPPCREEVWIYRAQASITRIFKAGVVSEPLLSGMRLEYSCWAGWEDGQTHSKV